MTTRADELARDLAEYLFNEMHRYTPGAAGTFCRAACSL